MEASGQLSNSVTVSVATNTPCYGDEILCRSGSHGIESEPGGLKFPKFLATSRFQARYPGRSFFRGPGAVRWNQFDDDQNTLY